MIGRINFTDDRGYEMHCRECAMAKVLPGGKQAVCAVDVWKAAHNLCSIPNYAGDCDYYDPMDLECDGSPLKYCVEGHYVTECTCPVFEDRDE